VTNGYLHIARQDGSYTASGSVDLTDIDTAMRQQGFPDSLINGMTTEVTITFPGSVTSANGSINGDSVTWHPAIGANTEIAAVAQDNGDAAQASSQASVPVIDLSTPTSGGLISGRPSVASSPAWVKWALGILVGACVVVGIATISALVARRRADPPIDTMM
jgi:hypothetical protein